MAPFGLQVMVGVRPQVSRVVKPDVDPDPNKSEIRKSGWIAALSVKATENSKETLHWSMKIKERFHLWLMTNYLLLARSLCLLHLPNTSVFGETSGSFVSWILVENVGTFSALLEVSGVVDMENPMTEGRYYLGFLFVDKICLCDPVTHHEPLRKAWLGSVILS